MGRINWRHHLPSVTFLGASTAAFLIAAAAFLYFGFYNIAADVPHTRPFHALLESLRDRSIAVHARGIQPPSDLASPQRIAIGAGLYSEMCSACHVGPGVEPSEMSIGIYPPAPDLAKASDLAAAQQFWVIKHGVKLSAMPAWGKTHPDPLIWDMVAFVRRLPGMTPEEYKRLVASAPGDHDEMMKGMPGMK